MRSTRGPDRQGRRRHRISGRGLGLAYASELARRGAAVVINDVDADVAEAAVEPSPTPAARAVAEVVPVGTSEAAQALVDRAVEEFGRLDILVNNAGILRDTTRLEDDRRRLRRRHHHAPARHLHLHPGRRGAHARAGRGRPDHLRRLPHRPGRQLRPDQLRRRQGRHRRHGPHLGDGARPRRDHRQRDRPGRRHRDDRDRPLPQALRRRAQGGRPAAAVRAPRARLRQPRGRRGAGRLPRLRRRRRHHRPGRGHRRRPPGPVVAPERGRRRVRRRHRLVGRRDRRRVAEAVRAALSRPSASSSRSPRSDSAAGPRQPGRDRRARPRARRHARPHGPGRRAVGRRREVLQGRPVRPDGPGHRRGLPGEEHGRGDLQRRHRDGHRPARAVQRGDRRPRRGAPRRAHPLRLGRPGPRAVRHPAGPQAGGVPRGARVQVPPVDPGLRAERPVGLPAVRGAAEPRRPGAVPHRPDRHRRGPARRARDQAALLRPDAPRRRRRRLPRAHDHHGAPVGALAGRRHLGRHAQGQRLHRPVRVVAQVLPAAAGQGGQRAAEAQGALRLGLSAAAPRALDRRLRAARHQARGQAADHEGERDPGAEGLR